MSCTRTVLALSLLLVSVGVASAEPKTNDHTPPVFHHTPVLTAVQDEQVVITTQIVDESDIFAPLLWWRYVGQDAFQSIDLTKKDDLWGASIPANQPIEYWLEAYDELGNGPAREGGPDRPFKIQLTPKPPVMKPVAALPAPPAPAIAPDTTATPPLLPPPPATAPPVLVAGATIDPVVRPPDAPAGGTAITTPADSTVISLSDHAKPATPPDVVTPPPANPEVVTPPANPPEIVTPPANPPEIVAPSTTTPPAAAGTIPDFEKPDMHGVPPGQVDLNAPPHDSTQPGASELAGTNESPIYKRWWFWTGTVVVVAGAVTGALLYVLAPQAVNQNVFQASVKRP